ncbi:RING/FYVE/PHD zinc finger superfamily protein [Rhynchospora pubera]|uniref:RING/FYVE/PHD zinc finger superfamily protein n=1 Tax=Rhynchospora pubera TaxID=906938 RepID=A0AAV8H5S9_9POAL|nr:RING/FYVE/PHD zinc finger superfamily protein [Rhynchospora pubera]
MASGAASDQTIPSTSSGASPPQVQSLTTIHSGAEVEEEEDQCRICRCVATSEDPLRYPCACSGSIRFVHQDCLLQWLNHSGTRHCEVCGHTFSFQLTYAEKTPSRLSFVEQLSWVGAKTWTGLQFSARLAIVLFVWLVMVPSVTAQIWDMIFIKSFRELGGFLWFHSYRTMFHKVVHGQVIFFSSMFAGAALFMRWEVLGENRIRVVDGGPNEDVQFVRNESFHEIIGMRGPAIHLAKRAFQVQLRIGLVLFVGLFLPFSWGRIILNYGLTGHASDWTTLAVGYLSILGPVGIFMVLQFVKNTGLTGSAIVKALSAWVRFVLKLLKQGFVIMVVLGAFPWFCGWWLHICTMKMVQVQVKDPNISFLFGLHPLRMLAWWACGILSLVVLRNFLLIISKELREGTLDFLQIPTGIDLNSIREYTAASLHENAYRVLLHTGVFMILMVVLVFLPFKLVWHTVPSFFPLNYILCYPLDELRWTCLRSFTGSVLSRQLNIRSAFKFLLHHWLSFVGGALDLEHFLLPMDEDANRNASTSRFNVAKECQDHQVSSDRLQAVLKIAALIILGSISLVFLTAMMIVPISLGRAVFSLILWIPTFNIMGRNDEINFLLGCYIISKGRVVIRSLVIVVGTRRVHSVVQLAGKCCIVGLKSSVLLFISVLIIPLLTGLLLDLTIEMPLGVSINEGRMDQRPVFYFPRIWVFGCVPLIIWIREVLSDVQGEIFGDWHVKLTRVKADGFSNLKAVWVLCDILYPLLSYLLNWLCIPYVLAMGVFPLLGYSNRANSSVYHFAWIGYRVFLVLCLMFKKLHIWLSSLHDHMRDDRYLIGRTLRNYQEDS